MHKKFLLLLSLSFSFFFSIAQQTKNRSDREKWFQNLGFGMFIHWNVDVTTGAVISHSLAGASTEYVEKYINELPKFFNPKKFDPDAWASLAKLAGMKYVVFTAKHHSGFCMFKTSSTPFNIMNTPFKRDATKEIIEAFRKQGIAIGLYFSPEDFYYFHKNNIPIGRLQDDLHFPTKNNGLMKYDKEQVKELLTNYGKIDIMFFDGPGDGLREYAWSINPDLVITRDAMKTPEQFIPNQAIERPWESCYTMGTDWQFKPTNDPKKSGTEIINMLIEIRAKGGNFLLNVGPNAAGEIQLEEENLLREVALWNMANSEAIYTVKPLPVVKNENVWFTQSNDEKYIYAYIVRKSATDWKYGERKDFIFQNIEATAQTKVNILGYGSKLVEYKKDFDASLKIAPTPIGLVVSAVNGQRFYTNNLWPNTVVMRFENARFKVPDKDKSSKVDMHGAQ